MTGSILALLLESTLLAGYESGIGVDEEEEDDEEGDRGETKRPRGRHGVRLIKIDALGGVWEGRSPPEPMRPGRLRNAFARFFFFLIAIKTDED